MKRLKKITHFMFAALLSAVLVTVSVNAQGTVKLTDAEVASAAVTANKIDINHAAIALERSENETIRNFAETMISDHKAVIQKAVDLVNELGVTPKDNAVTQSLMKRANSVSEMLKSIPSEEFNETYINNEVEYHKAVIDAVKNVLIPQTQNDQLKGLLEQVVPILQEHLEHAKMVQDKFTAGDTDMY